MLKVSYGPVHQGRKYVLDQVAQHRAVNNKFRVIDLGGAVVGWTAGVADTIVDIQEKGTDKNISLDICNHHAWHQLLALVEENGIYDYAICTHTLEDVYDPVLALRWLPKIAKQGIITMPSIRTELSRLPAGAPFLGYVQHRWIFDHRDDRMLLIPKLSCLESIVQQGLVYCEETAEIRFEWSGGTIPFAMFMNNYLGPDTNTVITELRSLINSISI